MAATSAFPFESNVTSNTSQIPFELLGTLYPAAAWVQIRFQIPIREPLLYSMKMVAATRKSVNRIRAQQPRPSVPLQLELAGVEAKADLVLTLIKDVNHEVAAALHSEVPIPPWTNHSMPNTITSDPRETLKRLDLDNIFPIPNRDKKSARHRHKRDFNAVQVNLNLGDPIKSLFSGINALFRGEPTHQLSHKVTLLVDTVKTLASHFDTLLRFLGHAQHSSSTLQTIWWALDGAETALRQLILVAAHLAQGRISSAALSPGQGISLFRKLHLFANQAGYAVPFQSVFTIFTLPVTSSAHKTDAFWEALLHAPLVDKRTPFRAYWFPDAPFAGPDNKPFHFQVGQGILGISEGLPAEVRSTFVAAPDVPNRCLQFNNTYVCPRTPILKGAKHTCPSSLLLGNPGACSIAPISGDPIPILRHSRIFAFLTDTSTIAISCPDRPTRLHRAVLQTVISLRPGCSASTNKWHYTSPKTSAHYTVRLVPLPPPGNWTFSPPYGTPTDMDFRNSNATAMLSALASDSLEPGWSTPHVVVVVFCSLVLAALGPSINYLACRLLFPRRLWRCCTKPDETPQTSDPPRGPQPADDNP